MAVKVIDSATVPPARKVMTFDAVPPGELPTRMSPAASWGSSPRSEAAVQAAKGMIPN